MSNFTTKTTKLRWGQTARNYGALLDIRKTKPDHFMYFNRIKHCAVNVEIISLFEDDAVIQIADEPEGNTYSISKRDFMRLAIPWTTPQGEAQLCIDLNRMNLTISKSQKRVNELHHIDVTPVPEYNQPTLFR